MGISGIGPGSLLLILLIVVLLFGTKRLRNLGSDFSEIIKSFRKGMSGQESQKPEDKQQE